MPYDPVIPISNKTIIQRDTHTPTFIPLLFTIGKAPKQPKCPLTDEWIKKILCVIYI